MVGYLFWSSFRDLPRIFIKNGAQHKLLAPLQTMFAGCVVW